MTGKVKVKRIHAGLILDPDLAAVASIAKRQKAGPIPEPVGDISNSILLLAEICKIAHFNYLMRESG